MRSEWVKRSKVQKAETPSTLSCFHHHAGSLWLLADICDLFHGHLITNDLAGSLLDRGSDISPAAYT